MEKLNPLSVEFIGVTQPTKPGYDGLGFYRDPANPRLLVPKQIAGTGLTLNLGHRHAPLAILVAIGPIIAIVLYVASQL